MQGLQIEFGVEDAIDIAHSCKTSFERQRADVLGKDGPADGVHNQVHAALAGCFHDCGGKVVRAGTEGDVQPERREGLQFGR